MLKLTNSIALILILFLMFSACSNEKQPSSPKKDPPNQSETAKATPPAQPKSTPAKPQQKPQQQPQQKTKQQPQSKTKTKTQPKKNTQQTKPKSQQIGYHETALNEAGNPRITNLKLAIKSINGKILKPGEEFSFNKTVGQRTETKGYKEAKIYKNKEEVEEVGGGICQLSSTLFCAAREAKLKITERHEHQLPVDYAKKGDDATVYYGSLDLKFVNTCKVPVKISCSIKNRKVKVSINTVVS